MDRYVIKLRSRASRRIKKLPKDLQGKIFDLLDKLCVDPRQPGVVKMSGFVNLWRARIGDYRVVYEIHDDVLVLVVVMVGHRSEVYKDIP